MGTTLKINKEKALELIQACQLEVEKAISMMDVPMACIITDFEGNILAQAHNTQNTDNDPTAHAEINALRKLGKIRGSRYLEGCVVFSNAESCSMCMSACIKARIRHFFYGAPAEQTMDPWITMSDIAKKSKQMIEIHGPILGEECARQITRGRQSLTSK